ncbi:putative reverse transcriptase domain-containing protein [Tanacetum coccineum]
MAPTTRRGPNTPVNNTNPNNMTPESIQAMIDQALLRNSTNGDGSHSSHGDNRRNVQTARPCFYADFMKCQPLNFKGTEGVVGLTWWIEKMESVFNISGCAIENQVKFATCTLLGAALTWWNGQIRTLGPEAYAMTWEVLKKKMTDKYCPQGEIKKLEIEPVKPKKLRKRHSTHILNSVPMSLTLILPTAKPKTLDETIELANDLMDRKLLTYAERQSDNKRRADDSSRNNHGHQQQPFKRQNVAKVYNMGTGERKPYGGSLPKCNKCHLHHNGPCTQRCHKCNKIGHFARDCRNTGNTNVANTQKGNGATPKGNGCFECGASGHFKRDCPKLKNKDGGNGNAQGWVYAVVNAKRGENAPGNPDQMCRHGYVPQITTSASLYVDTGADRSFISTAFSSLINIAPTSLENCYDVELADGKLVEIDTIIRGCTLNFLDHPFNIDLMPVELGSFDVIIGMDWLRRCHAVLVCDEKTRSSSLRNKTDDFCGNESSNGRESRLTVISCSKAQEYIADIRQERGGQDVLDVPRVKQQTLKNRYPLPRIDDLCDQPQDPVFISKIDLRSGYHQLRGYENKDIPKTAFELGKAITSSQVSHFGLTNALRFFEDWLVNDEITQKGCKFDWGEKGRERFPVDKAEAVALPTILQAYTRKGSENLWYTVMQSHKCFRPLCYAEREGNAYSFSTKELNMRQRRWLELLSDYDCDIRYHPGKAKRSGRCAEPYGMTEGIYHKERLAPPAYRWDTMLTQAGVGIPCYGELKIRAYATIQ